MTPPPPPPVTLSIPLRVDLQGEIQELYFLSEGLFGLLTTYVLIKVQIVNKGSDEATITNVGLRAAIGDSYVDGKIMNKIPDSWRIKKMKEGMLTTGYEETPIDRCLGAEAHTEIYRKGVPHVGWIAFEFYSVGDVEFPNAEFNLLLKDSFGNDHRIQRKPMFYKRTGELVRHFSS